MTPRPSLLEIGIILAVAVAALTVVLWYSGG